MWPKRLKNMPSIKAVMTPFPYSIDREEPLSKALEMMANHRIHHLPVIGEGELLGVINYPDVKQRVEQSTAGETASGLSVDDAPRDPPYVVDISEPLDRVLAHMAEHRNDAALVVKQGRLAGIFTLTDACRCFAESLREFFPLAGGDEAA